jgi:CHRD domain
MVAGLAIAATVGAHPNRSHRAHQHPNLLTASLNGAQEVPGPGDPDGRGSALIRLLPRFEAVCFRLSWRNIANPTAAHIHVGRKGVAGPIVVNLVTSPVTGNAKQGCVSDVPLALIRQIRANPRRYYVNIHNASFPAGAIRGQLKRVVHRHHARHRDHD